MNIRKPTDYTTLFTALDAAVAAQLPQMELYCEMGRVVSGRGEKGAAVAASEYLQAAYPAADGFSPRNLRRMRDFYRMYGDTPELLAEAMRLNWTQNVVIMEAGLTMDESCWYIRKTAESGLSKTELLRRIERAEHSEIALGESVDTCYTVENDEFSEKNRYEEYPVYLPRQYLPQPHGRVRDEGLGQKSWAGVTIPYRIGGYQPGGDRKPRLSPGAAQAGGAWNLLQRPCGAPAHQSGFIVLPLEKPCNIRRFRLSNPQTVCTFPCFFPYGLKQGKDFYSPLTTLSSSRAELRFASLVEWA